MSIISTAHEVKKPMDCIIYTRVSSDEQVTNFSLGTQEEACRKHAKQLGYNVLETFIEEGVSAKTLNRPKLIELLDYCRKNKSKVTSVIAYRIDRIARETSDYLAVRKKLYEYGIKLESATEPTGDSPNQKFIETIFAASAELDNSVRAEKARTGLRARFESGLSNRPPLGYKANRDNPKAGSLIDEKTFEKTKQAWELMGTGTKSLSEMASIMNDWGLRTVWAKREKLLTKQACSQLFRNPFYYGKVRSFKYNSEVDGIHPKMITEELFFRVQSILTGRSNALVNVKHIVKNPEFPLRGIVKCTCGKNLVAGNCKGRNKYYSLYWCSKCKGVKSISSEKLEEKLIEALRKLQPSEGTMKLFTFALRVDYEKTLEQLNKVKRESEKKQTELKQLMVSLVEGHMKGLYPTDIFMEQKAKIEDQLLVTGISKNEGIIESYNIEGIINFTNALWHDLGKAYLVSDYSQRRILLGSIYPSGITYTNNELLNHNISPIVKLIRDISANNYSTVRLSADLRNS